MKFPKDDQSELIGFYGNPGTGEVGRRLVSVVPPFKFTYEGKPFRQFMVHEKVAPSFRRALEKIWEYYGHDQKRLDDLHISRTAGTYNPRKISGSNKWSNHAYGAAVDINSEENGFGTSGAKMPKPVVAAFKSEGFAWGGDYRGRTDPMHFEAIDRGEPARTFEEWLAHYGLPAGDGSHNTGNVLFHVRGKMSTFGGPFDTGMTPTEGLALFNSAEDMTKHGIAVLPVRNGVTGLGRRLNPDTYYLACRWDYSKTPKKFLQSARATVVANGKSIVARPVDWGPNERTGRVADLSPALARDLGLQTDDICEVIIKGDKQ